MTQSLRKMFDIARTGERTTYEALRAAQSTTRGPSDSHVAAMLDAIADVYLASVPIRTTQLIGESIDLLARTVQPGNSLVTCCRNREKNLLAALRTWIEIPEIDEVIIVDWSSEVPVHRVLARHGLLHPKVRVLRVEGQTRWILSYAFNCGFRIARFDKIVKADADIMLDRAFFERNSLSPGTYLAGNWRTAGAGQEHVNGFFYARRADLVRVKGFNEHIVTYGWDDDDLYQRLSAAELSRRDVDPGSIHHIPHGDEERLGINRSPSAQRVAAAELEADPAHKIRVNKLIAEFMPEWNPDRRHVDMLIEEVSEQVTYARQGAESWHLTPPHIREVASYLATVQYLSWTHGPATHWIEPPRLKALLHALPLAAVNRTWIELMQRVDESIFAHADRIVILDVHDTRNDANALEAYRSLDERARLHHRTLYLHRAFPPDASPLWQLPSLRFIGPRLEFATARWTTIEHLDDLLPGVRLDSGDHDRIHVVRTSEESLLRWTRPPTHGSNLAIHVRRPRLIIDAQHGLGNRLRALGSGRAIAEATDRDFVLVWSPDCHCEARFDDLFHPDFDVLESVADLGRSTRRDYNYMEIEPGGKKGVPIDVAGSDDICVRTAFVVNHASSEWETENRALRRLRVRDRVQTLVDMVAPDYRIALHVRSEGAAGDDRRPYDAANNWTREDHDRINHWRALTGPDVFVRAIRTGEYLRPTEPFFLASDSPDAYARFDAEFGDARVRKLQRSTFDRSTDQLTYALADAILLGRGRVLLGSNWSSFTELASRLAAVPLETRLAGVDFR